MPYSEQHKCFFFHITKAAGTAVEKTLGMYGNRTPLKGKVGGIFGRNRQHFTYAELVHFDLVDESLFADSVCFAIVRDPLDRIVSEYFWLAFHKENISFKDFVIDTYIPSYKLAEENALVPPYCSYAHFYPQHLYECKYMSEYLVFDTLDSDWKAFVNKYTLDLPKNLKKRNKTKVREKDFLSYYDSELLSIVNKSLDKDIQFYCRISTGL